MSKIVTESIDLRSEDIVNLVKCSYYFLRDNLGSFEIGSDALFDELVSPDMSLMDMHEFVGKLLFTHLERYWAVEFAHGDVIITREGLVEEASVILRNLASEGTLDLMSSILPAEYNSDREIHWVFGSIIANEVIIHVLLDEIRRSDADVEAEEKSAQD